MPRLSVVVPVCDGMAQLERSLPAIFATLDHAGERDPEVIVVDDGSTDDSAEFARKKGASVVPSGGRMVGPARARNVGVESASGKIILFVDCDVVVHEDVAQKILEAFNAPDVVAIFGSYDSNPSHPGFMSQYVNLRHHHVHQKSNGNASTWWSGLGAIRREVFEDVGGFDADRYPRPSIEDIELGVRLRAHGHIRCVPTIQGTHLKRWSLGEVVRTDIFRRALPWANLMFQHPKTFGDLNVSAFERFRALIALALVTSAMLTLYGVTAPWLTPLLFLVAILLNRDLARLFNRCNGPWFAFRGLLFHQLYYIYSSSAYVLARVKHGLHLSETRTVKLSGPPTELPRQTK